MVIGRASKETTYSGTFAHLIRIIEKFVALAEQLSEGQKMSRLESIPKMWDKVKDLKPESIKQLQASLQHMQERFKDTNNDLAPAGSKRNIDEDETTEVESLSTKAPRTDSSIENITRLQTFGEEGTCVIPSQCKCTVLYTLLLFRSSNALHTFIPSSLRIGCTCPLFLL